MISGDFDYLDVSALPAPEPLQLALEAIQRLLPGTFLHLHHRRYPRLLFERLKERGFESDVRSDPENNCEVFIWKKGDNQAGQQASKAAHQYLIWNA